MILNSSESVEVELPEQITFHSKKTSKRGKTEGGGDLESYPLSHASEFAGFELVALGFLEPKHKELAFEVDNLLIDFFGGLGSNLLHLFFSLRHHLHGGRLVSSERR